MEWQKNGGPLAAIVSEQTDACLAVYREDASRVEQDANNELRIAEGGYRNRQLYELLQNAVDATHDGGGRLEVRLTADHLYVANDGAPFTADGVRAVMASDLSPKNDDRIGRFGIGFKSVLAVSSEPKIFSRTVCLSFDATWAADAIRSAGFTAPRYPTMRLARALDPVAESVADPILAELMTWASTVVVLPLRERRAELADDLRTFPKEFLLFSPHVREIRLLDSATSEYAAGRTITNESLRDGVAIITESGAREEWRVFRATWRPSEAARRDAGRLADRAEVEIAWAAPRRSRHGLGNFWAYFPTHALTTLSGIVNAPWRLGDDRLNPLPGAFNEGLLTQVLPGLIARNLGVLHDDSAPAAVLDLYPARGREPRSWADGVINEPIYESLRTHPSLPDCAGRLQLPSRLRLIPSILNQVWIDEWVASGRAPLEEWVHWDTAATPERRAKARRLVPSIEEDSAATTAWLESLARDGSADGSEAAIRLAARMVREGGADRELVAAVLQAKILRLEDGSVVRPVRGRVFVRATPEDDGATFVDDELAARPGIRDALGALGVHLLDKRGELQQLLVETAGRSTGWDRIWQLTRELPQQLCRELIETELGRPLESKIYVRTAAGQWTTISGALLPGSVVPADGRRDRECLIDPVFHEADFPLLHELGAVSEPVWREGVPRERWVTPYEQAMKDHFLERRSGSKPHHDHLLVRGDRPLWPLDLLERLSEPGRVAMTRAMLGRGAHKSWRVEHATNRSYGVEHVIAPEIWMLRKHGMVETSFGPLKPTRALLENDDVNPEVLPVVLHLSESAAAKIGVREVPSDLRTSDWRYLTAIADAWPDDERRTEFYTWLPDEARPETLIARVGQRRERVALRNVGVADSLATYEAMIEAHVPAILVPNEDEARRFIEDWEMPPGKDLLREEVIADEIGEPTFLLDDFPPLKLNPRLALEDYEMKLQRCSRLVRMVATPQGQVARPIKFHRESGRLLVTAQSSHAILQQVSEAMKLDMDGAAISNVLANMKTAESSALRRRVREAGALSPEAGLVEAVGVDNLRRQIPRHALEELEAAGELGQEQVARLALAVHGVGVLKGMRAILEERGLEPPREFSGKQKERRWVVDLNLPAEWAGFPSRPAPAREMVDGPLTLKPLHPYQERVTERIRGLLADIGPERGVVSLPTGAGKTRVTVQALVEEVTKGRLDGPIVWIAQSEELCEQAAESWTYVWRALGPTHPLVLSRLWGSNEVEEEPGGTQVVIATDAKLDAILAREGDRYEWLREPTVVIVDEAHTSVAPRYTRLLDWMNRSGRTRSGGYLIGLTATPYRGTSQSETERLVRRYDSNLLDEGILGENPYAKLQGMGVLAQVQRRTIDGAQVEFTEKELEDIKSTNMFPSRMEEELGRDRGRNDRIVQSILGLPSDWPVLLFAPSVDNARTLAALLSHHGVRSVSVSSGTEPAARRHYIDEFRQGRIRVLTNYQVLTQGFDAPAVRAVFVCRPTFSPNVYQQMVGRGLRGPLNGGSEEVLIVDVEDNLNMYGERLAFREFEQLWRR